MKFLLNTQEERCRMEVYNEYLRKIPQLLEQLEAVEKMYEKAVMEEKMLETKADDSSRALYADRLARTKKQCKDRADDIREQARLIFALKAQIENESYALRELIGYYKKPLVMSGFFSGFIFTFLQRLFRRILRSFRYSDGSFP